MVNKRRLHLSLTMALARRHAELQAAGQEAHPLHSVTWSTRVLHEQGSARVIIFDANATVADLTARVLGLYDDLLDDVGADPGQEVATFVGVPESSPFMLVVRLRPHGA